MLLQIHHLINEQKCYEEVRQIRWPEGVHCPFCAARLIRKRGFHTHQAHRQRYRCQACGKQFDDLTGTIFEGHHLPLKVWILSLYFMGLNLSNEQIAAELDLSPGEVQAMTSQLRQGIVVKKSPSA
jgi:transposase-like protein